MIKIKVDKKEGKCREIKLPREKKTGQQKKDGNITKQSTSMAKHEKYQTLKDIISRTIGKKTEMKRGK